MSKDAYDTSELARKPPKNAEVSAFDQWAAFKRNEPERWAREWKECRPACLNKADKRTTSRRLQDGTWLVRTDYEPPHILGASHIQILTELEYQEIHNG